VSDKYLVRCSACGKQVRAYPRERGVGYLLAVRHKHDGKWCIGFRLTNHERVDLFPTA
jgi:hypothetical protein